MGQGAVMNMFCISRCANATEKGAACGPQTAGNKKPAINAASTAPAGFQVTMGFYMTALHLNMFSAGGVL
jgi:hypothetical protein